MIYGGDEVSALVLDVGTSSTRLGYAGEDSPRCVIPTSYGYTPKTLKGKDDGGMEIDVPSRDTFVGETGAPRWRPGMEVGNPMTDGLIFDFSPVKDIIEHGFTKQLAVDPRDHPILVTEPAWNTAANRERMAEIMFEDFQVPAFYISNNAVLSAFSSGKGTALVVDIGKSTASVTPVVDGFVLRRGIFHSSIPTLVQSTAHSILSHGDLNRPPIDLRPYQLIDKKQTVDVNQPPRFSVREDRDAWTTASWRTWALQKEIEEWMAGTCAVLAKGYNDDAARMWPRKTYEFPTGFNTSFGAERFIPGDIYFTHQHLPPPAQGSPHPETLPDLLASSLRACEPDIRPGLFNQVVVTGGGAILSGLSDRLAFEVQRLSGGQKVRMHVPGNPIERRYAAWLGGSILASLGTFHQLWISKQEWEEHGRSIVASRCK